MAYYKEIIGNKLLKVEGNICLIIELTDTTVNIISIDYTSNPKAQEKIIKKYFEEITLEVFSKLCNKQLEIVSTRINQLLKQLTS